MLNKKQERKKVMEELVRRDILDSAMTIIQDSGEKQLTMDRVAAGAGIAKGTGYLYFKNKQELLYAVVEFIFAPLVKKYTEILGKKGDPFWTLEQCVRSSLDHAEANKPLFKGLRTAMFNTRDQYIGKPDSWYWTTVERFATVLEEGVKTKKLRPMNSVKVATLFLDSINCLMSQRILTDVTESIEEDVGEVMALLINGLSK